MRIIMKKIYLILLFFGFIGYFNIVYSAQATAEQQPEEYHMDLPDENVNEYYNIYKTRLYEHTEMLEVELTDVGRQKSNGKIIKLNPAPNKLSIDRYFDNSYEQIYIYFPLNGHQPTTEDAVKWSCANIDNTETSPITDWYMKMFGVIPYKGNGDSDEDYIQAGYDEDNQLKRIISYDQATMENDKTLINVPSSNTQKTKKQFFIDNFRKIASTSVGRVLLYRLLIEIRRVDKNGNGGEENNKCYIKFIAQRNKLRTLHIKFYENGFPLFTENLLNSKFPGIYISPKDAYSSLITNSKQDGGRVITFKQKSDLDVNLFHELCHWLHSLINYERKEKRTREKWIYKINNNELPRSALMLDIGLFFYGYLDGNIDRAKISNKCWWGESYDFMLEKSFDVTNFEEMHTILGAHASFYDKYINGDDLCENLYRAERNLPLRFGHCGKDGIGGNFIEDENVIERVIKITKLNLSKYEKIYNEQQLTENFHTRTSECSGLGKFKCYLPEDTAINENKKCMGCSLF